MSSKIKLDMQERISYFFQSSEIMEPFALTSLTFEKNLRINTL